MDRALASEAKGPGFESQIAHHNKLKGVRELSLTPLSLHLRVFHHSGFGMYPAPDLPAYVSTGLIRENPTSSVIILYGIRS